MYVSRDNSIEFAWCDMDVTAMGRTFERITAVEYDTEEDKKQIYGRGRGVKGIQRTNEKPKAAITLGQSEIEAMIRKAQETNPFAKLNDLTFDINIAYIKVGTAEMVRDRIVGFTPTKSQKAFKQGDTDMEIKVDGLCMNILYNQ